MLWQTCSDDLEGVYRTAIVGGVHFGIQNAESGLVKISANARKQISLVRCVHHNLQAFTHGRCAGAYHGFALSNMARQLTRVPRNGVCIVAHKVAHIQGVPQHFMAFKRLGVQG